jgi:hypothetical protein
MWLLQISQLHPPAPEFAQEDAAADVAHSSKIKQLIRAKDGAAAQDGGKQQQQAEQGDALPMDFCWTSVIWTLALQHKNLQVGQLSTAALRSSTTCWLLLKRGIPCIWYTVATCLCPARSFYSSIYHSDVCLFLHVCQNFGHVVQVQRMALKTLLKRNWPPAVLAQLPLSFFTSTLLPALMSPIHHKVPSAAGLSATGSAVAAADTQQQPITTATGQAAAESAVSSFNVISQAAELLRKYVAAAGPGAARALLLNGLLVAGKPGQDLPRSGLLAVMKALAAAADAAAAGGSMLRDISDSDAGTWLWSVTAQLL